MQCCESLVILWCDAMLKSMQRHETRASTYTQPLRKTSPQNYNHPFWGAFAGVGEDAGGGACSEEPAEGERAGECLGGAGLGSRAGDCLSWLSWVAADFFLTGVVLWEVDGELFWLVTWPLAWRFWSFFQPRPYFWEDNGNAIRGRFSHEGSFRMKKTLK